jgi:hypothetical protein
MRKLPEDLRPETLGELRGVIQKMGRRVPSTLDTLTNPDSGFFPQRPLFWTPHVEVRTGWDLPAAMLRGVEPDDLDNGVWISSLDQFQWGDLRTGARFPLPPVPLELLSPANRLVRELTFETGGFPSEMVAAWSTDGNGVGVSIHGAHGQFEYYRLGERDLEPFERRYGKKVEPGTGAIVMSRTARLLSPEITEDLERQLGEGVIEMGAHLVDRQRKSDREDPLNWSSAMRELRDRVEIRRISASLDYTPVGRQADHRARLNFLSGTYQGALLNALRFRGTEDS